MKKTIAAAVVMSVLGATSAVAQDLSHLDGFTEDVARHWQSETGGLFEALPLAERIGIIVWYLQQQPKAAGTQSKILAITAELNDLLKFYSVLSDDAGLRAGIVELTRKLERGDPIKAPPSVSQISSGRIPDLIAGGQPVREIEVRGPATGGGGAAAGGGGGPVMPRGGEPSIVLIGIVILTAGVLVLSVLLALRIKAGKPAPQAPGLKIDVRIEVVGPSGATQTVHFRRAPISVGRAPDNDLVLDDTLVSRRHFEIRVEEGRMAVVDLGSSSGTVVDDRRASLSPVYAGSIIRVGQTALRFL